MNYHILNISVQTWTSYSTEEAEQRIISVFCLPTVITIKEKHIDLLKITLPFIKFWRQGTHCLYHISEYYDYDNVPQEVSQGIDPRLLQSEPHIAVNVLVSVYDEQLAATAISV